MPRESGLDRRVGFPIARRPIYLDHHATTPLDPRVLEAMQPYLHADFGNAASVNHAYGWTAAAAVDDARERIAAALGAPPESIIFTSGATEANNIAIQGAWRMRRKRRPGIVTAATEHPAVLDVCRAMQSEGAELVVLPVDSGGLIELSALREAVSQQTALVSLMAANNEIGVVSPIEEFAEVCREHGVLLHSDAAQAVGRLPLQVERLGVDLLSFCAHKFYGPKGIGALYLRPGTRLLPIMHGGGHERGWRPGTLAVPLVVGMARALELAVEEQAAESLRLQQLRDRLWQQLREGLACSRMNGDRERRLPGNLNVCFEGVDGDRLLLALTDLAVSSGSACSTADPEPSHVLLALGLTSAQARASIRFGLGRKTTQGEVDAAATRVIEEVERQLAGAANAGLSGS